MASSKIKSNQLITETVEINGISISNNGYVQSLKDASKSGYRILGIVGLQLYGNKSEMIPVKASINGHNIYYLLGNQSGSATTINLHVDVLYSPI